MPLLYKPHTATHLAADTVITSQVSQGVGRTSQGTIKGLLRQRTPTQILDSYGVVTQQGAIFLMDTAGTVALGDWLTIGGVNYEVKTRPQVNDAVSETSHAVVVLERVKT